MATLEKHCIVTSTNNEHQIFVLGGLVFNGLWAQLADLQEQIGLIAGARVGSYLVATLWNY